MPRKFIYSQSQLTHRITLPLTREMKAVLDRAAARCKDDGGKHMARTAILRSLVCALKNLEDEIDWDGIEDESALLDRFVRAFSKGKIQT